jgi:hypothetical protein
MENIYVNAKMKIVMTRALCVLITLSLQLTCHALPCKENEILLRNRTCMCPFFQYNGLCMRKRYQTTVNATLGEVHAATRQLLMDNTPMLLTIDASNHEAMQTLAASLRPLVSAGTVVTSVVDALDILVGGEPSATMEIVNASVTGTVLTLTVDYRLPDVDYFFWFMHFGSAPAPCPPFDVMDGCCRGDMGSEFLTTGVDCSSGDPLKHMELFVAKWNGRLADKMFTISVDLDKVPFVVLNGANVYRLGLGMVVFGRLAQNTESRVEIQLNNTITSTSVGAFQFSGIEYSRLQLETCGGQTVVMHLVIKAPGITAVQSVRYGDEQNWTQAAVVNVTIDADFVDVRVPLPSGVGATTLYVLLSRSDLVLTRVVARTSGAVIEHCNAPVVISPSQHERHFVIDVLQGNRPKYSGQAGFVQLTDVAALTLKVRSNSTIYRYSIDNISVVYSLVDSKLILERMPEGKVTPELEALCDEGNVCLIETLMELGACTTRDKCEDQGVNGVFVMPLYPWGRDTLKNGTYTAMLTDIKEEVMAVVADRQPGTLRRLMSWIGLNG